MLAAIHQLHYLPWLRYVEKMARADVFVVLDDVQYTKNGFQNRNKIKHAGGWMYLTVPVKAHAGQLLREVEIAQVGEQGEGGSGGAPRHWGASHWRAIETNYRRAPFFDEHAAALGAIYGRRWTHLNDVSWELLTYLRGALGIETPMVRSSELAVPGEATDRLVAICQAVGADCYYSGSHAADAYLDAAAMEASGIEVVLQEWRCPPYEQRFPQAGFIADLSVLDLLLNEGPRSRDLVLTGGQGVRGFNSTQPRPTPSAVEGRV